MDEHSVRLLRMIENACRRFRTGETSLLELQSTVESIASALEQTVGTEVLRQLTEFTASLEHIYFMCYPEEHREKADQEVEALLAVIMPKIEAIENDFP